MSQLLSFLLSIMMLVATLRLDVVAESYRLLEESSSDVFVASDRLLPRRDRHRRKHQDDSENEDDSDNEQKSSKGFRLKMYWEPSYYWQESHRETFWCMQCRNKDCKSGNNLQIRDCRGVDTHFEFIGSGAVQMKVSNTNLCLTMVDNEEVQLKTCDSEDNDQKFTAGNGDFNGRRFEIYSVSENGCVANPHHPRDKEIPFNQNKCVNPRDSRVNTSFWVKY
jgi:Ricin-type beta-trefoil lectin domain